MLIPAFEGSRHSLCIERRQPQKAKWVCVVTASSIQMTALTTWSMTPARIYGGEVLLPTEISGTWERCPPSSSPLHRDPHYPYLGAILRGGAIAQVYFSAKYIVWFGSRIEWRPRSNNNTAFNLLRTLRQPFVSEIHHKLLRRVVEIAGRQRALTQGRRRHFDSEVHVKWATFSQVQKTRNDTAWSKRIMNIYHWCVLRLRTNNIL